MNEGHVKEETSSVVAEAGCVRGTTTKKVVLNKRKFSLSSQPTIDRNVKEEISSVIAEDGCVKGTTTKTADETRQNFTSSSQLMMDRDAEEEISSVREEAESTRTTEVNVMKKEMADKNRIQVKKRTKVSPLENEKDTNEDVNPRLLDDLLDFEVPRLEEEDWRRWKKIVMPSRVLKRETRKRTQTTSVKPKTEPNSEYANCMTRKVGVDHLRLGRRNLTRRWKLKRKQ